MGRIRLTAVLVSAAASAAALTSVSSAEVSQKQGVRVSVQGAMAPTKLPRKGTTPVSVSVAGKITTLKSNELPQLKAMSIAINQAGILDLKGIPHCRINHINPSTTEQALAACGSLSDRRRRFLSQRRLAGAIAIPLRGKAVGLQRHDRP